jgi:hypothetical protein
MLSAVWCCLQRLANGEVRQLVSVYPEPQPQRCDAVQNRLADACTHRQSVCIRRTALRDKGKCVHDCALVWLDCGWLIRRSNSLSDAAIVGIVVSATAATFFVLIGTAHAPLDFVLLSSFRRSRSQWSLNCTTSRAGDSVQARSVCRRPQSQTSMCVAAGLYAWARWRIMAHPAQQQPQPQEQPGQPGGNAEAKDLEANLQQEPETPSDAGVPAAKGNLDSASSGCCNLSGSV